MVDGDASDGDGLSLADFLVVVLPSRRDAADGDDASVTSGRSSYQSDISDISEFSNFDYDDAPPGEDEDEDESDESSDRGNGRLQNQDPRRAGRVACRVSRRRRHS